MIWFVLLSATALTPQIPDTTRGLNAIVQKFELSGSYDRLRREIARIAAKEKSTGYLRATKALLEDPTKTMNFADDLTFYLRDSAVDRDIRKILFRSANLLDVKWKTVPLPGQGQRKAIEEAEVRVVKAMEACEAAFAAIPVDDLAALDRDVGGLMNDFARHIYVHQSVPNREAWKRIQTVRWAKLFDAASYLTPFVHDGFSKWLGGEMKGARPRLIERPPKVEGRLLYSKKTAAGWVIVGGTGNNKYDGPLAFVLDLGGDDVYEAEATRSSITQRVNVVIDVKGDDIYRADSDGAQACGRFGVSFLVDHEGNDRYKARRLAQGSSLAGVGVLVDHAGKDEYEADAFAQGAGCFGVGLLIDRAGDDEMTARLTSQGFAWPLSCGFLVDLAGNDRRVATRKYPSVYGTKDRFNGMSQGASIGFRTLACGGFGVLVDGGGDDDSEVGEFGFGCGYYFGCGIVRDFGGKDLVRASRYGIATGAHFGIGAVLDDLGNDTWKNQGGAAALAGNWDLSVSCFLDRRGNDRYVAPGLSVGAATITSFASFVDLAGLDRYEAGLLSFGRSGHAEDARRKTQSVSLFVDLGGAEDVYPALKIDAKPTNNAQFATSMRTSDTVVGVGAFVDK